MRQINYANSLEIKSYIKNNDNRMKSFKNQSISLVKFNTDTNKLQITSEAISYLSSLDKPLAIITIAGLYRTGKSFLVNKLVPATLAQQESAFRVGTTTQSMTKGLNVLGHPICVECQQTGQQMHYLLIDSEGIGSCQQSMKYDMDLLILIFLISSTVVYNSMGAIDELSLQQLQVVLKLKACVENTQHEYDSCSYKYCSDNPKFIWVLRDFALQLVDKNGHQITADEYLEQCLEESPISNSEIRKKNEIRRAIKQNLGERHCYTLVRPTIKEEDLQHLSNFRSSQQSKIRSQFIGQLECLKQSLFSGKTSDIKKINGQPITGRLFARILAEYLQIINNNELPKVHDVWSSVMRESNEENFGMLMDQLKKQTKAIKLPITKQQLKLRLNEIENRIYKALQKTIHQEESFKQYHKQFLKIVQKLNKQLKQRNDELRKNSLMNDLHHFVKENLIYETLQPARISEFMKQFIERIRLKINGAEEGYQYLIGILSDVFFIVEQKSAKIDREFSEIKHLYDNLSLDKSNVDLTLMNLKRQYHDALKSIAKLQQGQADADKNYSLSKNKIFSYESKIMKLQAEIKQEKQLSERVLKDVQQKSRSKIQQITAELKKVRTEKTQLEEELGNMRQKISQRSLTQKKEMIFQEKLKESFDKFNGQRISLNKEIESYKKHVGSLNQKYTEMKNLYEKQCEKQKSLEEAHYKKQQNLIKQFQNLKQTFKQTKASYEKTYETYQSTEQKMNNLAPTSTAKKEKFQTPGKDVRQTEIVSENIESSKMMKKFYQTEIQKIQQENRLEIEKLEIKIINLDKELSLKRTQKDLYETEAKQYKQKCFKLEKDIIEANSKFNEFLKEIEEAKKKERMLYEQSIMRLLNNIDKLNRQNRDSVSSSGIQQRSSLSNVNLNKRRDRVSQYLKESVSFGNVFKTK